MYTLRFLLVTVHIYRTRNVKLYCAMSKSIKSFEINMKAKIESRI